MMVPPSHWCIFHGPKKVNPRCMPNHFPLESTMVRDFLVGPVVHPSLPVESLASKICKKPKKKPIIWDYTTHKNGHFGDGLWWFIPHDTDSPKHQLVRFLVYTVSICINYISAASSYGSTNGAGNFGRGHVCSFPSKDHQQIDPITFPMLPSCYSLENLPEMQIILGQSDRKTMDLPWIFMDFPHLRTYGPVFQCELFQGGSQDPNGPIVPGASTRGHGPGSQPGHPGSPLGKCLVMVMVHEDDSWMVPPVMFVGL